MSCAIVFCEAGPEGMIEASLRTAGLARRLADELVLCGRELPGVAAEQARQAGARRLVSLAVPGYAPRGIARALWQLAERLGASAVLAAGTDHGNEILAHLGALSDEEMVANCLAVERRGEGYAITRQRWGGSLLEEAHLEARRALLTVAAEAVAPASSPEPEPVGEESFEPSLDPADLSVTASEQREQAAGVSLASARVVVSGGRGVGGPEGFGVIEEIAEMLGGAVGVSRVVTSLGWRPHREQVGQTGTKVTPELYLACGISGAIQHLAGCQSAKTMVAINTDPEAPIMSRADYAVIGDLAEVLPALRDALAERLRRQ